jgi:hypothetical protein
MKKKGGEDIEWCPLVGFKSFCTIFDNSATTRVHEASRMHKESEKDIHSHVHGSRQ